MSSTLSEIDGVADEVFCKMLDGLFHVNGLVGLQWNTKRASGHEINIVSWCTSFYSPSGSTVNIEGSTPSEAIRRGVAALVADRLSR